MCSYHTYMYVKLIRVYACGSYWHFHFYESSVRGCAQYAHIVITVFVVIPASFIIFYARNLREKCITRRITKQISPFSVGT